jgi:transcriptional regulator with XRE-family HTH domain
MSLATVKQQNPWMPDRVKEHHLVVQLVAYREKKNISTKALAQKIGMTEDRLEKIESGENMPKLNTVLEIASGLGLELALVGKTPNPDILLSE